VDDGADDFANVEEGPQRFGLYVRDSGQTIKHVHLHILPRKSGDFQRNDDIYDMLEKHSSQTSRDSSRPSQVIVDDDRKPRSLDEMVREATEYRSALESMKPK